MEYVDEIVMVYLGGQCDPIFFHFFETVQRMMNTSGNPGLWAVRRVFNEKGHPAREKRCRKHPSPSTRVYFKLQEWVPLVLLVVRTPEGLSTANFQVCSTGFCLLQINASSLASVFVPVSAAA